MSDVCYRPLIEDMTWSYSRIKCFDDCPYRFFLTYICGIEERPMFYASYGSFMHRLLERYYKGELTPEEMRLKYLLDFRNSVAGERPKESTVYNYINQGAAYLADFKPIKCRPVAIEKKLDFTVRGEKFTGFSDLVGVCDDTDELWIVDHKSRDLKQRSNRKKPTVSDAELDQYLRQLYLYAVPVREMFGKYPDMLVFNCFRTNTVISEPFSEPAFNAALDWAKNKIEEIKNTEDFHPYIDYFQCRYICGVGHECCFNESR